MAADGSGSHVLIASKLAGSSISNAAGWRAAGCSGLGYASEYETLADTALKRARAIVKRLGGSVTELPLVIPEKPARMHWETYFKLRERCQELEELWARQCRAMLAGGLRRGGNDDP